MDTSSSVFVPMNSLRKVCLIQILDTEFYVSKFEIDYQYLTYLPVIESGIIDINVNTKDTPKDSHISHFVLLYLSLNASIELKFPESQSLFGCHCLTLFEA